MKIVELLRGVGVGARWWIPLGLLLLSTDPAPAGGQDAAPPAAPLRGAAPPPEMERLTFLIGHWDNETEFVDSAGNITRTFRLSEHLEGGENGYTIRPSLGGWMLEGGANGEFGRSWYRYDPAADRYVLYASDFFGNIDVLEGQFEGEELVLTEADDARLPNGGTVRWRWVFTDIDEDGYGIRQLSSTDGGRSWVLVNRQRQRRLPASVPESGIGRDFTDELASLVGAWEAEPRTSEDGRAFRFLYDLEWYDRTRTLLAFTIRQRFDDGEVHLLWEGLKGFDPIRRVTFSDQWSPGGLSGRGVYAPAAGGGLVVHGRGFGPQGVLPPVRDVLTPLAGERGFTTVTYLLRDGDWEEVGRDTWRPRATAAGAVSDRVSPDDAPDGPLAPLSRLVGGWEVTPRGRNEPTGRLDVRWLPGERTLHRQMTLLQGPDPGPRAHGIIGFDPADGRIRGVDFQSMIWAGDRLVDLMFVSEYWVDEDRVRRLYTVHYPPGEPLMPLPGRGGTVRRYRETYDFTSDDTIEWTTEIMDGGEWEPFGGAGAGSSLRRLAG